MNAKLKAVALFTLVAGGAFMPVANSETLPAINGPVQWSGSVDFDVTQGGGSVVFTVPSNKRLIIQYLAGAIAIDQGDAAAFIVQTTVNGVTVRHYAEFELKGPGGGFAKSYVVAQPITLYADPGTDVTFIAGDTLTGRGAMSASISGRLYPKTADNTNPPGY